MMKDVISPVGCNSLVNIRRYARGACSFANLLYAVSNDNCSRWSRCGYGVIARGLVRGLMYTPSCVCGCLFSNLLLSICYDA